MKKLIVALPVIFLLPFFGLSQTLIPLGTSLASAVSNEGVTVYGNGTTQPYAAYDTDLLTVRKLVLSSPSDLTGIDYLLNLDSLEMSSAQLTSLLPLSNLAQLKKIKVYNSSLGSVTDFSFLNNMPMLTYVQFLNCKLTEINNLSLTNTDSIDMEFDYNMLDNEDIQSFYNVPKFRYLNIYGSNVGAEQQLFSAEVIYKLINAKPGLRVRYRMIDQRSIPISNYELGTSKYYITFTECDTLGSNHYFLKYDVKYGSLSFPEGAELVQEGYTWYLTPKQGIVVADEMGRKRELGYAGRKLRSDIGGLLTPSGLLPSDFSLYGFGTATGSVTHGGSQYFTFADFPFPFSEIIDYYMELAEKDETPIPTKIRGSVFYNKNVDDPTYSFNMQLYQFVLPTFTLKDILIRYDGVKEEMEGSVKLSTGYGRFEFDADVIFSRGKIDKLILNMGTGFPLGWTGLNVTSIGGGVEDFTSENWKVVAKAGLESVISYPYIGPLFSSEEMSLKVAPFTQFEASGNFSVFGAEVAKGTVKYVNSKNCLTVQGNVNFGDILVGSLRSSLTSSYYSGIINGVIKTPSELPWKFKYLQNKTIASILATLNNNVISCETDFFGIPLAQKLTFNSPDFPYFTYEIGENLNSLTRVLKSTMSDSYNVPENTAQILIVAGNDESLFHVSAISPSGKTFGRSNTAYQQYDETKQTVMIVRDPEPGVWKLSADTDGDYQFEVLGADPAPAFIFDTVTSNDQTDKLLQFKVLNAPEDYRIHLCQDDDMFGFDGYRLTSFSYRDISNNDLFSIDMNDPLAHSSHNNVNIYVQLYDYMEKNLLHSAYALTTYDGAYAQQKPVEAPQNFTAELISDTVHLSWDATTDENAAFISIHYKKASELTFNEIILSNDTNKYVLTGLQSNTMYEVYLRFRQGDLPVGPESERISLYIPGAVTAENLPPYFITKADDEWIFFSDTLNEFSLNAVDPDGDELRFSVADNSLGVHVEGNLLKWTPASDQAFDQYVTVIVSDGVAGDTLRKLLQVYEKKYQSATIQLSSYSVLVNHAITVQLFDYSTEAEKVTVLFMNTKNQADTVITLYRTGALFFTGVIVIDEAMVNALNIEKGDELEIVYTNSTETITVNLTADYNVTPGIELWIEAADAMQTSDVRLYPNPVRNILFIDTSGDIERLEVYNIKGTLIESHDGHFSSLSMDHLETGLYFVKVYTGKGTFVGRVVKI